MMRLTRRNAIAAVVIGGFGTSAAVLSLSDLSDAVESAESDQNITDSDTELLTSVAEAIYPSEVTITTEFIWGYLRFQSEYRLYRIREAGRQLDEQSQSRYGVSFDNLSVVERETLLREMGVDRVAPDPDGSDPERIRYYLVNGLLYALFTDPQGSRLVGIDNPRGYPGGYRSYAEDPSG